MKIRQNRFWIGAISLIGLSLFWPGDIFFINDGAKLIANALNANEINRLALLGLEGTAGVRYGPIPTWFYQACLFLTKNLILISIIKNLTCSILLFSILVFMSRKLDYPKYPILLIFVSPYLYLFNRSLWDNTFTIALSALLYLLFIQFSQKRSFALFYLCLLLMVTLIHIDLKSVFSIIAFLIVFFLFEYRWIYGHWRKILFGVVLSVLAIFPYSRYAISNIHFAPGYKSTLTESLEVALTGIKYFSFFQWSDYYLPELYLAEYPLPSNVALGLLCISSLSVVFFFLGSIDAIKTLCFKATHCERFDHRDKLSLMCLIAIGIYVLFLLVCRHHHHPQALVGVWFAYFYFLWRYFSREGNNKKLSSFWVYFTAMGALLLHLIFVIHGNGGNRSPYYGATLRNQIDVVTEMLDYSPKSEVIIKVQNYRYFPQTFYTLTRICSFRLNNASSKKPIKQLLIDYEKSNDVKDGHITLKVNDGPSISDN